MIVFAAISPHPPIILPGVGSRDDRNKVKKTIQSLKKLGNSLGKSSPDIIVISSPHPDWGFNVPLFFLAKNFKGETKIYLTGLESPAFYFKQGKQLYQQTLSRENKKIALIASGDLSHRLKEDGPYGFHPDGPKFDEFLIKYLKEKKIKNILQLDEKFPQAGDCGLRSFSFLLGIMEAYSEKLRHPWKIKILSYENPFGVGYLVADFLLNNNLPGAKG